MDENTIFQTERPSPAAIQPPSERTPAPPPPLEPSSAPQTPIAPLPPFDEEDESSSFLSKLLKIGIGLLVVLVFIFAIYKFALPLFLKDKSEKVTLTYWGLWEDKNIMQGVILDFQKENPNITVNYVKEDVKQYRERLEKRIELGTGPDIFRFHNTWVLELSNILLAIPSDVITTSDFKKLYPTVVHADLIKNGAIYGIPLSIDTLALFVNKELFQASGLEVPSTWDDFIKVARALTVKGEDGKIKTAGAAMGAFDNINHAPDIVSLLLVQNGADLKNLAKTAKSATDALNFYTSFAIGDGNVWDSTLDPSILAFSKGNLAMYFGYSWDIFIIKAANPTLEFEVHPPPHLPGRDITIASYWVEGVSSKSKHQKEALLFLKFLSKREAAQKLYTTASKTRLFGEPYARLDLLDSLKDNVLVYPFVLGARNASSSFFAADTYDNGLNTQANAYLGNAVRSILGNTSAESALETLSKGVSSVLEKYSAK